MPRDNIRANRIAPSTTGALTLQVLRRSRISPHFCRVTLGGPELARFGYLGYDQWFRLFLPTPRTDDSTAVMQRIPDRLSTLSYVKYLMINKDIRPVLRNYTVRDFRPSADDGPELDIDFVLHGDDHPVDGWGASWATTCEPGDTVAILDEGASFKVPESTADKIVLVAEESGLPAVAGILASLPPDATGRAVLEVPCPEDRQPLRHPDGIEITWLSRADDRHAIAGRGALREIQQAPTSVQPFYGFVVGEQAMVTAVRRHWVAAGVSKQHITFCGYWRHDGA